MITESDLLRLPYTPDLTEAGITYARRSLLRTYGRGSSSQPDRLRRRVASIAAELAFRRHMAHEGITLDVKVASPLTDPEDYDVSLGGHRCDVRAFLISHRDQIAQMQNDLEPMLRAPALVPLDQYAADGQSAYDLYVFAFLSGVIASSPNDVRSAYGAGKPVYLIRAMPRGWVSPHAWIPLGPLALKSETDETLQLELGGLDARREFLTCAVELPPHTRRQLDADFHSLAYLHVNSEPGGRLGIHSPSRRETYLVEAADWSNIWVSGLEIYFAGWITRDEFRRRAHLIPAGSPVFQYDRTRTQNLAVAVSELKPLRELFELARKWESFS